MARLINDICDRCGRTREFLSGEIDEDDPNEQWTIKVPGHDDPNEVYCNECEPLPPYGS
jgi:hypothetical protein